MICKVVCLLSLALSGAAAFAPPPQPLGGALLSQVRRAVTPVGRRPQLLGLRAGADGGKQAEQKFFLNVKLCVKPERREEFLECIRANQKGTRENEPLALMYEWGECTTQKNTFYFQEQYVSKEGFEAHTKMPHFADWEKFAATDPFSEEPEVIFFKEL
mmetsp:Transcript_13232/g.32343  ORF Transcript_13232/g.32343 Transcript_13232/m.32343 type:complete len:159 (-) Transcript_13232:140-616(-)|eukprot:CAMPEP_0206235298 /NCGR_PEP_ID=MMETSP0047_2-20121206/13073_1 /ASSEMBLY_ACC=CAM_ASM_000192 /TAXON_ID=195065 /ORGANISM="Chroomonas mesostigmatica_cf, Strain CCMP1168" /LENGTH=158 /DNA_ID=CAMNT_0053659489 /DNA_START=198 /DNA_END=674 /DNA_ORIENTATION=-